MPVGQSGRIVIEIDPELKQELYAALADDGLTLKQWFLDRVGEHLRIQNQLSLQLMFADSEAVEEHPEEISGKRGPSAITAISRPASAGS